VQASHQMKKSAPKRQKIYLPKVMTDLMWALTSNSTKVHYKEAEICIRHNMTLDTTHITECDCFRGMEPLN